MTNTASGGPRPGRRRAVAGDDPFDERTEEGEQRLPRLTVEAGREFILGLQRENVVGRRVGEKYVPLVVEDQDEV
jgi:hypothetical protein